MVSQDESVPIQDADASRINGGAGQGTDQSYLIYILTYHRCPLCNNPDIPRRGGYYQCSGCKRIFLL